MTITTTRYAKDGIETTLYYCVDATTGQYSVALDDVELARGLPYRAVWAKGFAAEAALAETGWARQ